LRVERIAGVTVTGLPSIAAPRASRSYSGEPSGASATRPAASE
jgi:hypothetical protein